MLLQVVVEHPEAVRQLHREFLRCGAEVMQAFTYYARNCSNIQSSQVLMIPVVEMFVFLTGLPVRTSSPTAASACSTGTGSPSG